MTHKTRIIFLKLFFILGLLLMPMNSYSVEPFEVRVIYFKPVGSPPTPIESLTQLMQETQEFYKAQMEEHGYGAKTFRIESDENHEVVIHTVDRVNMTRGTILETRTKI